jgi:lycopene cyclase domain-containing protein
MHSLYLLVNLCSVAVPMLFSFHPKLNFYRNWKQFFMADAIAASIFITWDILFTHQGVWGFNLKYVIGLYFYNLPIEEVLFFICIPFACVFSFHCLTLLYKFEWKRDVERMVCLAMVIPLLTIGFLNFDKAYTSTTFMSTAIVLLLLHFVFKVKWLGSFLTVYGILQIPFFIVNGILTGTGLNEPVVWYNNAENLGIRMLSIPVEDIFYGMDLLMLVLFVYHLLLKRKAIAK